MEQYKYLSKKRAKVLGVFNNMVEKLKSVNTAIAYERASLMGEIDTAEKEILEAKAAIAFLNSEEARNNEVAGKITALL